MTLFLNDGPLRDDLSSGDRDHRFLDLRDGIVFGQIELDMRNIVQLVGRDDASDNRGPLDCEGFGDRAVQLVRMARLESMAPAGAGERGKIRIRKFDRLAKGRQAYTLGLQLDESKTRIVVDADLHRQLVMHSRQELAHQHVEAAVAAKGDDLTRAVEHLDAVGLAECSSDTAVVEGTQDPL